jgi:hypothetical protein
MYTPPNPGASGYTVAGTQDFKDGTRTWALTCLNGYLVYASRYFFIRAARKLTRRFDQELYENEESRLAKALPLLRYSIRSPGCICLPGGADDDSQQRRKPGKYTGLHQAGKPAAGCNAGIPDTVHGVLGQAGSLWEKEDHHPGTCRQDARFLPECLAEDPGGASHPHTIHPDQFQTPGHHPDHIIQSSQLPVFIPQRR